MEIVESTIIDVLNYSDSYVSIPTQLRPDGYLFEPKVSEDQPFAIPLTFAEVRVVNSQANVFREGILRFTPEIENLVYEKLGIRNWKEILTDEAIKDIILNPSKEGLEKIIGITSSSLFERVRGTLQMLLNSGRYDISTRVKDVIKRRYEELYRGQRRTDITIAATSNEYKKNESGMDLEAIKAQVKEELQKESLEKMREELRQQILLELQEEAVSKQTRRGPKSS